MRYSDKELSQAITSLEAEYDSPFKSAPLGESASMQDRLEALQQLLDSRYDYKQHISPTLRNPVALQASTLRSERNKGVAGLSTSLRVHLEPRGKLDRQESAADRMEVFESHVLLETWEPLRDEIHQAQMASLFWAGWLQKKEFKPPEKGKGESNADYLKRRDAAKGGWFPYEVLPFNPETVKWSERRGKITSCLLHFELPIIDIMQRFYDADREDEDDLLKLWEGECRWLAIDTPQPVDRPQDAWRRKVEVYMYGDPHEVSYCVKTLKGQDNTSYRGVGDVTYEHKFGQTPLLLAEGVLLPDRPVAYRREGLMLAKIEIEKGKAIIKSQWASKTASPPMLVENELPKEMTQDEMRAQGSIVDENGALVRFATKGRIQAVEMAVDATQDKLFGVLNEEGQIVSMGGLLFSEEGTVAQVPAAVQLASIDQEKMLLASATRSEVREANRLLDMIESDIRLSRNHHRKAGDQDHEGDWPYVFTTSGQEAVQGRKVQHGELMEVKPQDLDYDYTRVIEPIDLRLSTQAARLAYAVNRKQAGAVRDEREYLELIGIEDTTDFLEKKLEETLVMADTPRVFAEARLAAAEAMSILRGVPVEQVMQEMGGSPEFVPEQGPAMTSGGITRTGSPQTDSPVGGMGALT